MKVKPSVTVTLDDLQQFGTYCPANVDEWGMIADLIKAARLVIIDPDHWTKGQAARDRNGNPVNSDDPSACKWCPTGALSLASIRSSRLIHGSKLAGSVLTRAASIYARAEWELAGRIFSGGMIAFNDAFRTTHEEVIGVMHYAWLYATLRAGRKFS